MLVDHFKDRRMRKSVYLKQVDLDMHWFSVLGDFELGEITITI